MTHLQENVTYYWKVRVQEDTEEQRWSEYTGTWSFITGTLPAAPTSCTATYVSDSQIDLEWNDNASNETGYEIYRSVDSAAYSLLDTVAADSTGHNDTDVSADHTYQYKIRAKNDAGYSSYCETSIVATSPTAPSNVQASLEDSTITLTWTDNSSITDLHQIERSVDGGEWTYLDEDSDGTYEDTAGEWESVKYRVRAKSSCGPIYSSYVESNTITFNSAPSADFSFWGSGGTEITFDARSSSDPDNDDLTFTWDMGNGDTSSGDYITYDYKTAGTWTVTLTVDDGELTDEKTIEITIYGQSGGSSSGTTPSESVDKTFSLIGEKAKETVQSAKDSNATPIILIIIAIIVIAAYKKA
jgi:PKD repeat protein